MLAHISIDKLSVDKLLGKGQKNVMRNYFLEVSRKSQFTDSKRKINVTWNVKFSCLLARGSNQSNKQSRRLKHKKEIEDSFILFQLFNSFHIVSHQSGWWNASRCHWYKVIVCIRTTISLSNKTMFETWFGRAIWHIIILSFTGIHFVKHLSEWISKA